MATTVAPEEAQREWLVERPPDGKGRGPGRLVIQLSLLPVSMGVAAEPPH
jgi:hypothetical protein